MDGLADLDWFRRQIWQLYGFDVPGVDYSQPVEVDVPWPVPSDRSEAGWRRFGAHERGGHELRPRC